MREKHEQIKQHVLEHVRRYPGKNTMEIASELGMPGLFIWLIISILERDGLLTMKNSVTGHVSLWPIYPTTRH
jgi:predicted transcriptional regulator